MKYLPVALASALAALMVVACGGGEPTVSPAATPSTAAEPASAIQPIPTLAAPQAAPAPPRGIAPSPTSAPVAAPAPTAAPTPSAPVAAAPVPAPTSPAPVSGENHPPDLASIGDRRVALGSALTFVLSASDSDGDRIAFNVSPLPLMPGSSLNASTGTFVFNPGAAQVGSFELTFHVSDGQGGADSETLIITVDAPVAES